MKRSSIIIPFILCMISSCTSKLEVDPVTHADEAVVETKAATGQKYSVASDEAEYFAKVYSPEKEVKSVKPYGKAESPALYVINYNDGWIMIAGDMRVEPVLAYSEEGSFNATDCENENLIAWLNSNAEGIEALAGSDYMPENDEIIKMWRVVKNILGKDTPNTAVQKTKSYTETFWHKHYTGMTVTTRVSGENHHLLSTKWGQDSPWNSSFPYVSDYYGSNSVKALTGCVAVAISQVLYYFHYNSGCPTGLYHTISANSPVPFSSCASWTKSNYVVDSNRWDSMALTKYDTNTTFVSDLMADVASRVNMVFRPGESSAGLSTSHLTSFGLNSSFTSSYNENTIIANLRYGFPVIIGMDSHCWVIDGYKRVETIYEYTYEWGLVSFEIEEREDVQDDPDNLYYTFEEAAQLYPGLYVGARTIESSSVVSGKYYMNWGYDGLYDNAEYALDKSDWRHNSNVQEIIYNIH